MFLSRLHAGKISAGRLTALLYLADRLSVSLHWHTVTDDRYANVDGAPRGVGTARVAAALCGRGRLRDESDLDELSLADENVLMDTHTRYADMSDPELFSYMKKLPEAGRGPISYRDLALAVAPYEVNELADKLETDRALRWCIQDSGCRIRTETVQSPQ